MNENDQIPAILADSSYVIPGRLIKQMVAAAQDQDQAVPDPLTQFRVALEAMNIEYDWEAHACGDSDIAQVWFVVGGRELVFEFNSQTGEFTGMSLE